MATENDRTADSRRRLQVRIRGIVQGVGFRPFIYGLAHRHGLTGFVLNDSQGVLLEVEGSSRALEDFLAENRASTQTMLMHRAVWEAVRFDESIRRYQDWDFAIRAAERFRLVYLPEALVESEVGGDSISAVVKSYPHLLRLYEKHAALYRRFPHSDAVMNRRLGKRCHPTDPARAAAHFRKSFRLSCNPSDLSYYLADCLRARRQQKGQTP